MGRLEMEEVEGYTDRLLNMHMFKRLMHISIIDYDISIRDYIIKKQTTTEYIENRLMYISISD